MGLDMFLTKRIYIGANYKHNEVDGTIFITKHGNKIEIPFDRIVAIELQGCYWRKANHIHKWFVDNVQGGKDNCQDYEVSVQQIKDLIKLCRKVCKCHSEAPELLPTTDGFFFGGTAYDEWYFEETKRTANELSKMLKDVTDKNQYEYTFTYSSSW